MGSLLIFIIGLAAFLWLVSRSLAIADRIAHLQQLITINQNELLALDHQFHPFGDGSRYPMAEHPYTGDLDIFGPGSIFQMINRTGTRQGEALLAQWLSAPTDAQTIIARQQAMNELRDAVPFRQSLQAFANAGNTDASVQEQLQDWLKEPPVFSNRPIWRVLRFVLPAIILSLLVLNLIEVVPNSIFYGVVFLFLIGGLLITRRVMQQYKNLDRFAPKLKPLVASFNWIEKQQFTSPLLMAKQQQLVTTNGNASARINQLQKLLGRFDVRLNPLVFLPVNTFLMWDLHQAIALEQWRAAPGVDIDAWLNALAHFEAISSLANLAFNNPDWALPTLADEHEVFEANGLGHPLIAPGKRVASDFSSDGLPKVSLVTGSNMAGKSTFLRSIGVNIVLAMMGAPVCAQRMRLSVMQVMSSMRIADNLQEKYFDLLCRVKEVEIDHRGR